MARKSANTNTNPAPAAKATPAPATKPAPSKPGIFSKITTLALLILLANSATGQAANRYAQEHLTAFYRRMWTAIFAFIFIAAVGFYGFTLHGMKEVNIYVALFYGLLILFNATRPDLLMSVLYGGVAVDVLDDDEKKGVKSVFALYWELALTIMFIAMSVHAVIGFSDFDENPKAFPAIILIIILLLQMKKIFNFGGKLGATTAYVLTAFMLIFQISTLISQAWLIDKFGRDPLAFIRPVAEDKKVIHETKKLLRENRIKKNAAEAKLIYNKVKDGNLTDLPTDLESSLQEKKWTAAINSAGMKKIGGGGKEDVQWVVMDTFMISPNKWDEDNYGFQKLASFDFTHPITIKLDAEGIYTLVFKHKNGVEDPRKVNIRKGLEDPTNSLPREKYPLKKNSCIGCGILMINDRIYSIGEEIPIPAGRTDVYFSINNPQDWNDSGHPSENFVNNIGEVKVSLLTRA